MSKNFLHIITLAGIMILSGCTKEFDNPNATEGEVLGTTDGIVQLIVGMKHRFAVNSGFGNGSVYTSRSANALTTFEVDQRAGANQDLNQLSLGGSSLATNNQMITDLWGNCMLVNRISTSILDTAPTVISDTNVLFQVQRYALLYKAMALGTLAVHWLEFPITIGGNQPFVTRKDGLLAAINILNEASLIRETSSTYSTALGPEINLRHSINALLARYYLMLGTYGDQYYEMARQKALLVAQNSRSVFTYNQLNPNPIFRSGFNAAGAYSPDPDLGLPESLKPSPADQRVPYYKNTSNPSVPGFSSSDTSSLPLYLPGEMMLIQAETWARKGDGASLDSSKKYLDMVLTKTASQDVFRLGASLPPYTGPLTKEALLTEIYKNRCIELFMSGMKLEDSRRFERPASGTPNAERNRNYYPYPFQERMSNPNTPPKDPD
jgi:starch-binding outer membrane protein, SusD/RagB family